MSTLALHLTVATPISIDDPGYLSLLIVTALMGLTVAAIRKVFRRPQLVVVISGTSVLLVILTVLILAYLFINRAV